MKKKSILIKEFHHKELVKIAKVFGSQYGDLIESMILYFKKTGINPNEAVNENPAAMVKVLDKRIVSFLKVQERDILKPLRNEVYQYSIEQKKQNELIDEKVNSLLKWVKDAVVKINEFDKKRTDKIDTELNAIQLKINKQQEAILKLAMLIDFKNKSGFQNTIKNIFKNADQ